MRLRVTGVVQGVGFRPFVHRIATELGLRGTVHNDPAGVVIRADGPPDALAALTRRVRDEAPVSALVQTITVLDDEPFDEPVDGTPSTGFHIIRSDTAATGSTVTALPPDMAVCDDCLAELRDPTHRRYRYPFTTCTQCGPRFTITRQLPYDRPNTTMSGFPLCSECSAEYHDPTDRRHHAQPLACPTCGPHLALIDAQGATVATRDAALVQTQQLLDDGAIVAVKGLGGYHLMCDATNAAAVQRLRQRKRRGDKPFAVLVADLAELELVAEIDRSEHAMLVSSQRPIVLLQRRRCAEPWPELVAPAAAEVGVMLPCTPVQHLLLDGLRTRVLVCTSGNLADEPIVTEDAQAQSRLRSIADAWLTNDRPIHTACDDSTVRAHGGRVSLMRRARGYTPLPVHLVGEHTVGPTVLAMGGDLKGALCLAAGDQAFMSQHLGDHGQLATYQAARQAALQLVELVGRQPEMVAVDAHPGYLSARLGHELAAEWGVPVSTVQHHHAHVVAAMAEHGVEHPVLGIAFDGTGYGPDGTIWGGEYLRASAGGYQRVAHLATVPLPGGDAAIEHPARTALAHLWAAGVPWSEQLVCVGTLDEVERRVLRAQLEGGRQVVLTSSMGRLFDAVAALAGVRQRVDYEAQAAIELQSLVDPHEAGAYEFPRSDTLGAIDCAPVIRAVATDALAGLPAPAIAARFHTALVSHVLHEARRWVCDTNAGVGGVGVGGVVLTGGVFQNARLLAGCQAALVRDGINVFTHRLVPTNDGGLALGQAVVARAQASRTDTTGRA